MKSRYLLNTQRKIKFIFVFIVARGSIMYCVNEFDGLLRSPVDSAACRDEAALVKVDVNAGPCEKGSCQNSGRCRWYSSGGFFFSGCHCVNGEFCRAISGKLNDDWPSQ
jgi:hypothetical protein